MPSFISPTHTCLTCRCGRSCCAVKIFDAKNQMVLQLLGRALKMMTLQKTEDRVDSVACRCSRSIQ